MKVSIRLQNHGVKHHPHWWIVIAPNRKNMKGRIIEHVGYWCPNGRSQEIRSAIFNLSRIKYWMGCGAVPTNRVHKLLHEFGYLPKPWFYVKSEEELEKMKPNEEDLDDKKKRKIELKEKRKQKDIDGTWPVYSQYVIGVRPKAWKRDWRRGMTELTEAMLLQSKQNDMLRQILLESQFHKYQQIKKLSAKNPNGQNLIELQNNLKKLQEDLATLQKNSISLHPVKKSMIMQKINDLLPKVHELQLQQQAKKANQPTIQDTLLRRKVMHQVMVKRLTDITQQIKTYYKMLQPLTKESYLEFMINKLGLGYIEAQQAVERDFEQFQNEGIAPTKGELYRNYNLDPSIVQEKDDYFFNPDFVKPISEKDIIPGSGYARYEEVQGQQVAQGQQQNAQGEQQAQQQQTQEQQAVQGAIEQQNLAQQPEQDLSQQQIAKIMFRQLTKNDPDQNDIKFQGMQSNFTDYVNPYDYQAIRDMIRTKKLLLPTGNPVNPYPDLKSYIPEQYYDVEKKEQDYVVHAPSYYPEQQLARYREKIKNRRQQLSDQIKEQINV